MLKEIIDVYEELKKYVFIIERGDKKRIVLIFRNDNFYHLLGLHKLNLDIYFPTHAISKEKRYKYIKNNINKFENILQNQLKGKHSLELRVKTFHNLGDLLNDQQNTSLWNIKQKVIGSLFEGDFALLKIYDSINCLLGLRIEEEMIKNIKCVPISWMASSNHNRLLENKRPIYKENICPIPKEFFNEEVYEICA